MLQERKINLVFHELKGHLPFTFLGVVLGMVLLGLVQLALNFFNLSGPAMFANFFHTFHFTHIFLSAIATTAVYYRYEKNLVKTFLIGYFATLLPCGLSDYILPFTGGILLGLPMHLHICLIEEPASVLIANTAGILAGIILERTLGKISYLSHSAHVSVSSFASIFYLVSFGMDSWIKFLLGIFVITVIAVALPCCTSDIILPTSLLKITHGHEHEDEHTCKGH